MTDENKVKTQEPVVLGKIRLGVRMEASSNALHPVSVGCFVLDDAPGVEKIYGAEPTSLDIVFDSNDYAVELPDWLMRAVKGRPTLRMHVTLPLVSSLGVFMIETSCLLSINNLSGLLSHYAEHGELQGRPLRITRYLETVYYQPEGGGPPISVPFWPMRIEDPMLDGLKDEGVALPKKKAATKKVKKKEKVF